MKPTPHGQHPNAGRVVSDSPGAEEEKAVLARDLGQAGHHQHIGNDDGPAAHPRCVGSESPCRPGECRTTVGVDLVELLVAQCGEQHRHEGEDHDHRGLQADGNHHQSQGCGEAVGGSGRGDGDHNAGDHAQRTGLQPFAGRNPRGSGSHTNIHCHIPSDR